MDAGPGDIAFLQYTGGTTGVPKGAVLTHGNIAANMQQCHAWLHPFLEDGKERIFAALPLYHVFALMAALVFIKMGGVSILIANPRDIPGFVKETAKQKFTALTGVNTLFNALLHNPDFAGLDFSSLKLALGGGMAIQHAVAQRWKAVTGNQLIEAYGLTETSPAATANPLDLKEFSGSIGLPAAQYRHRHPRRRRLRHAPRQGRRTLHARTAGDGRLLAQARRNGDIMTADGFCARATSPASTSTALSASSTARRT